MKKIIAISISDTHLANWKQFNKDNKRLNIWKMSMGKAILDAKKNQVPLLLSGDLLDHPKYAENIVIETLATIVEFAREAGVTIYGINGNHDFSRRSTYANPTAGYFTHLSKMCADVFVCIDNTYADTKEFRVMGIPYINSNIDLKDALKAAKKNLSKKLPNILLIHTDLPGAKEPDGREVGTAENIDYKALKSFDLVLAGHIHRFQKLSKNTYMVGAPMQQRRSDTGVKMGYCRVYNDLSVEHYPLDLPEFKFHKYGTPALDEKHFWIEEPAPITEIDHEEAGLYFDVKTDRKRLAKNYMKAKGIKSKEKRNLLMKYLND